MPVTYCKILTFADDTKIVTNIDSIQDTINLQDNLNKIIEWTESNNMRLNNNKFEFITHSFSDKDLEQKMLQKTLQELPFSDEYHLYYTSI